MEPIQTDEEHATLLAEAEVLMRGNPKPGTPEGDRLAALADVIDAYENVRWPIPEPKDAERDQFRREQEAVRSRLALAMDEHLNAMDRLVAAARGLLASHDASEGTPDDAREMNSAVERLRRAVEGFRGYGESR